MSDTRLPLREALLDRWLGEDDDPTEWTDEMLLKRIEDLVGEGWYHAGKEGERAERYRAALDRIAALPHISASAGRRADFLAREALGA